MVRILVLHGPNLNLLGKREPEVYGTQTLEDIDRGLRESASRLGVEVVSRQSNHEGALVEWVQASPSEFQGLILNAGAFTHTSIALRDAVVAAGLPCVEVHLSNIYAREAFRHHSHIAGVAWGQISGLGMRGYLLALEALAGRLRT